MAETTRVTISDLRMATRALLDHLEARCGPEVQLSQDYFWAVPAEQRYDLGTQPTDLTVGQLSECVANVERIASRPDAAINYGLVWLGEVFEWLGATCEE